MSTKNSIKPYQIIGSKETVFPEKNPNAFKIFDDIFKKSLSPKVSLVYKSILSQQKFNTLFNFKDKNKGDLNNLISITDEKIDTIFTEKRNKSAYTQKEFNIDIIKNIDKNCATEMKEYLDKQEKALILKNETERKINNLSKFISKRLHKPEKDLLMNKTDGFRLKNQWIEKIKNSNDSKPFQYGVYNNWKLNLRKTESKNDINKKHVFNCYVGNGRENCDLWAIVKESEKIENMEKIIKPNSASIKDFRKYADNRTLSSKMRLFNINSEEMVNTNQMKVNFVFIFILNFLFLKN